MKSKNKILNVVVVIALVLALAITFGFFSKITNIFEDVAKDPFVTNATTRKPSTTTATTTTSSGGTSSPVAYLNQNSEEVTAGYVVSDMDAGDKMWIGFYTSALKADTQYKLVFSSPTDMFAGITGAEMKIGYHPSYDAGVGIFVFGSAPFSGNFEFTSGELGDFFFVGFVQADVPENEAEAGQLAKSFTNQIVFSIYEIS